MHDAFALADPTRSTAAQSGARAMTTIRTITTGTGTRWRMRMGVVD